jgi:hypothetical protein
MTLCETRENCKKVFEHFVQDFYNDKSSGEWDYVVRRPLFRISIK